MKDRTPTYIHHNIEASVLGGGDKIPTSWSDRGRQAGRQSGLAEEVHYHYLGDGGEVPVIVMTDAPEPDQSIANLEAALLSW